MIRPATISQVTNLELEIFAEFRTTALSLVLLNLVFDLSWVEQIKLEVRDSENSTKFIIAVFLLVSSSLAGLAVVQVLKLVLNTDLLALLELLTVLNELVELHPVRLVLIEVKAVVANRGLTSLLDLLHLLDEDLSLAFVCFFESLRAQVWTRHVLHPRLRHVSRHLLILIKLVIEDHNLFFVKIPETPVSGLMLSFAHLGTVLAVDGVPLTTGFILSLKHRCSFLTELCSLWA